MFYNVYRGPPGPPLKWWQKAFGWVLFFGFLAVWLFMVTVTGNDNWPDRRAPSPQESASE